MSIDRKTSLAVRDQNVLSAVKDETPKEKSKRQRNSSTPTAGISVDDFADDYFPTNVEKQKLKEICKSGSEEDPPLIIAWKNVHLFVETIPNLVEPVQPPFELPPMPTVVQFKEAMLAYVRTASGAAPAVELAVLPCTIGQFSLAIGVLCRLETHPWCQAIAAANPEALPLAAVLVPVPRSNTVTVAIQSPPGAIALWG
eukprot:gene40960-49966_t